MQVTEQKAEGLSRELSVVVPATDLEARLQTRLHELKGQVNLKGFRPGKVPISHLRRVYGERAMAEIVQDIVDKKPAEIIAERDERPAMQPKVDMTEDEAEAAKVLRGENDFAFTVSYEKLPEFDLADWSGLTIERPVVEVSEEEVEDQVKKVAESAKEYEAKEGAAENGDRVTIDFLGKIDGEAFEGGSAEDSNVVIGANQFIPGFEEQLIGVSTGDTPTIEVTFPEDYGAEHLAGKAATFDVTVKEVASAGEIVIDDDLAKKLGLESADRLREVVREQIEGQYGQATRQKVKRQILDQLDKTYDFELPEQLVQTEFDNIWNQVQQELEQNNKTFADEDTTEDEARAEYRRLAERRVRLGLVLSQIGEKVGVQISDEELQRAVFDQVRRYPGQEQQVYQYFQNNPQAVQQLRAPLYEEKVVDHLLEQANVTDKTVTKDELLAEEEEEGAAALAS